MSGVHFRFRNGEAEALRCLGHTLLAACLLLLTHTAAAHPISVTTASVYIEPQRVTQNVEVYAEDLYFFHNLEPTPANTVRAADLRSVVAAHGVLLLERLPVYDAAGRPLSGGVAQVSELELPAEIPLGELMDYTLVYRLERPLATPPAFLTFTQRLVDDTAGFPALVTFKLTQAGREQTAAETVEATLKPGQVRTIACDWSDATATATNRDAWLRASRDDTLAATALNSVRSFLYINRREVRHELLMPFPLLETFFTVDRAAPDFLSPAEQQAAVPKITEYFASRNPLTINGQPREPASVQVAFFTLANRDLTHTPPRQPVSAVNCRVGVVLSYPTRTPAASLGLKWTAFNRQAWQVDAFCFAGEQVLRPEFSMATRSTTFAWTRPATPPPAPAPVVVVPPPATLAVPWLAALAVCGGGVLAAGFWHIGGRKSAAFAVVVAGIASLASLEPRITFANPLVASPGISDAQAGEIFRILHGNLARALQSETDEEAAAMLAAAADGDLLRTLFSDAIAAARTADETGTRPVTEAVTLLSGRKTADLPNRGFAYACRWEVVGRVEHWGHEHRRRYRYDAVFDVQPRAGFWRLTEMHLHDAQLIEDETAPAARR